MISSLSFSTVAFIHVVEIDGMPWSSIPFCCEGFEEEADQEEAKGWLVPLRVLEPSILFIHHYNRKIALLFTSLDLCSIKCMYIYI